jgi:hypothetical protein
MQPLFEQIEPNNLLHAELKGVKKILPTFSPIGGALQECICPVAKERKTRDKADSRPGNNEKQPEAKGNGQ